MISTVEKGDLLEDKFYQYLLDQQSQGGFVYGAYPAKLCKIYKKKKYYCKVREADVEFDVVLELYREERKSPHLTVVFECKNHGNSIQEREINDFSAKLDRIFKHAAKAVIVVSSQLQSGADKVAQNGKMGIVKYCSDGFEVVVDRKGSLCSEHGFVKSQIFKNETPIKPLKFSAFENGKYFSSIDQLLESFDPNLPDKTENTNKKSSVSTSFFSDNEIQEFSQNILNQVNFRTGVVNLEEICFKLSIDLQFSDRQTQDSNGDSILGSANFDRKSILINAHDNKQRERFTIAHEIGHFCLGHGQFLRSETILERDLLISNYKNNSFNYDRLEFQANSFASHLLLPKDAFLHKIVELRNRYDIRDKGHGYIFVDDQPCNYQPYNFLLSDLSSYFDVSKQAIEIKLKKMYLLNDQRKQQEKLSTSEITSRFLKSQ